jgi:S-adenosylmethionine hydrolase
VSGRGPIVLLTDFGTVDGYTAEMKGVLVTLCPGVAIVDATHEVPRGDVAAGARALGRYWRRFPPRTIHLCVVDPGVGTARRPLVVESEGRFAVGPDNGLLAPMIRASGSVRAIRTDIAPAQISATFHGRDVFAPAAAYLATGGGVADLGPAVSDAVVPEVAVPVLVGPGQARGTVVAVDRFGNLQTNLPEGWLAGVYAVEVGPHRLPVVRTYGDVRPGEGLALIGSNGYVEIAVRDRSAAQVLDVGEGRAVTLVPAAS